MVEIVTFTGITLTLPGILSAAYSVLKAAYDIYGEVDMRRMQMRVLLDRCADLIVKLSRYLSQPGTQPSARITLGISNLEETCEAVRAVIEKLKQKGFLWCMVNQDKIDVEFSYVEYKIADAFALFNFLAHMGNDELQQQLQRARNYDRVQLNDKLDDLCSNDHRILGALMDQGGTQRRMEGILVDVLKCVRELGPEQTPKSRFLRSASAVLQRMSKGRKPDVSEDWIISGLDVDFEPTDAIGQGSFGRVFKGRWKAARVAIKQMYVDDARSLSEADRKMMYREAHLWSKLHHPNILHLYGACLEAATPFFVMQYCSLGNLCNYLVDYPDANRVNLAYDIAAGVTYLHGRNIVHADLKGVNILVDNKHTALVTDFGLSTAIDGIRSRSTHSRRAGARHGTLQWMAPEVLNGDKPTMASDIYSLALTIWEVFSGEIPFEGVNDNVLWLLIVNQERRPERPDRLIEDAIWDIMRQCWAASPFLRPSIQKVLMSISKFSTRLGSVAHDIPSLQIAAPSTYSVDAGTFSSALSQMSVSTARPPAPMPSREENGASSAESSRPTYSPEPFVSPLASDPDIAVSRDVLGQEGGDSTLSALTRAPEAGSPFEYAVPRSDSTFSQCDPPVEISPPLPPDPQDAAPVLLAPSSSMESSQHDALRRLVLPPLQIPSPEPSNDSPLSPPPSTSPKAKQFASPSRLSPLRELARSLAHDFQEKREQRRSGGFWEQWTPGGRDDRRSASYSPAGQESLLSQMIHILAASSVEEFSLSIALDVAERASANETNATEAVRALGTEFKSGDVLRQLSAAKLWAIMLRDASDIFLRQCMSRKFVDAIDDTLINHAASPVVKERLLSVLASAAYESARRKPNGESGFDGLQSLWRKFKPVGKPDEGFPLESDDPIYYVPKGRRLSVEPGPQLEATPTPVSRPPSPPADSPVESLAETLAGAQVSGMLARYLDEQSCIPSSAWEAKRPSEGSSGSLLRGPRQPGNSSGGRGREGGVSRSVSNTAVLNDPQELPQGLGELLTQSTGPEHSRAVEDQMLTYLRRSNEILAMLLRSNGQNNDSSSPSAPPPYPG